MYYGHSVLLYVESVHKSIILRNCLHVLSDFYFFPVLFLPVTLSVIYLFVYLLYLAERHFFFFFFFCLNNAFLFCTLYYCLVFVFILV